MATTAPNRLDAVWHGLCSADRVALVGHDRDELTVEEKARLMGDLGRLAHPPAPKTSNHRRTR